MGESDESGRRIAPRFNFGIGGLQRVGVSIPAISSSYVWSERAARLFPQIYRELAELEREDMADPLVTGHSMATYDRWPLLQDSQLLDSVTSLEALRF